MEEVTEKDLIDILPLDDSNSKLAQEIINEQNLEKVKDLTHLFNLNQAKKNVLRILKLNQLLDKVSDQMIERFDKTPDNFSNADLLNYMQVTQSAIDRANKSLNLVDETPAIQVNTQVNVINNDMSSLDRDAKLRITDAVKGILSKINSMQNETLSEVVEIAEQEKENSENKQNVETVVLLNEEEEDA
jgi:hypothetical protein